MVSLEVKVILILLLLFQNSYYNEVQLYMPEVTIICIVTFQHHHISACTTIPGLFLRLDFSIVSHTCGSPDTYDCSFFRSFPELFRGVHALPST